MNYSTMTRMELIAARAQAWRIGNEVEADRIEEAFARLDRRGRVMYQRSLQPRFRNLSVL
ncbi:hypothetical protein F6V30_16645 [Oryzomonas sagensis]|uniref:Uncharacterized protein n=1 Tax=Oryzomonas sagensis TaxID=2603857 RepID=A0ABQ6TK25_9BACT|nr:hypothetical protein [Oryzomonas sagensis]KAB0668286.1 hypothetical protein F6V30_16645 [Oryzomonas sagensis]